MDASATSGRGGGGARIGDAVLRGVLVGKAEQNKRMAATAASGDPLTDDPGVAL
jgi:hypothetical protein